MSKCKMILPKVWIAAIPKYWNASIPTDHPASSSEFSLKFETPEVQSAVKTMEENINTENSIITEDMLPENTVVGSYLGTYDVTGEPGVETLLSPEKVPANAVGVLVMHLNSESNEWEKVEDAHIKDGYVYGTLESFSPIAVFVIKRDTFLAEAGVYGKYPTFVANGVSVKVTLNENGEIVALDGNGKETIIPENGEIIGGTVDGSDIESTSIYVGPGVKLYRILGGSLCADHSVTIDKVSIIVDGIEIASNGLYGGSFGTRVNEVIINAKNSKLAYIAAGRSNQNDGTIKGDNEATNLGFASKGWVKNATLNLDNCEIGVAYCACASGNSYDDHTEVNITNSKVEYFITGGSNGRTRECIVKAENCEFDNYQATNRGIVHYAKSILKNCTCPAFFVFGHTDKDVTGDIEKVYYDITGGSYKLHLGKIADVPVTEHDVAAEHIDVLKISRSTELEFVDNADKILGDILRIK